MANRSDFTKDEMKLINQRARELMAPYWEHCRNLMLDQALALRKANGGTVTDEDLRRIGATVDIRIHLLGEDNPF